MKKLITAFNKYYDKHRIALVVLIIGTWLLFIRNMPILGVILILMGMFLPAILDKNLRNHVK